MKLGDFSLRHASLEVRYPPAYQMWDHSGALWTELIEEFPELTLGQAAPNDVLFRSKSKFEVGIKLESANVQYSKPQKTLGDFIGVCDALFRAIDRHLAVTLFNRVGCRLIYEQKCESLLDAQAKMRTLAIVQAPPGPHFGIKSPATPEISIHLKEGPEGVSIRISATEDRLSVELPLAWGGEAVKNLSRTDVLFDIDQYLNGPILPSQFSVRDWIKERIHRSNRDSSKFLEG